MTRYLLDSNVVSDPLRLRPSESISSWVENQAAVDLFISTVTVAEIWRGVLELVPGRRRRQLEAWFTGPVGPQALFHGRILTFDFAAALEWARLMAEGTARGRPRSGIDMIIAAIAAANDCIVVTTNQRHFEGVVDFLSPLRLAE